MGEVSFEFDPKTITSIAGSAVLAYLFYFATKGILFSGNTMFVAGFSAVLFIIFTALTLKFGQGIIPYLLLADIVIAALIINLSITLHNPIIFGDEGYYAGHAEQISRTLALPEFLPQGTDAHKVIFTDSPLFFVFVSTFFSLGGDALARYIGPLLAFVLSLVVFDIARKMYSTLAGVIAALLLLAMPSFVTYTVLLYNHLYGVLLFAFTILLIQKYSEKQKLSYLIAAGVTAGLTTLAHQLGILLGIIFIASYFYNNWGEESQKRLLALFGVFFVVLGSYYVVHNMVVIHRPAIPVVDQIVGIVIDPISDRIILKEVTADSSVQSIGSVAQTGVNQNIFRMNIINYIEFAYTFRIFLIAMIGLGFLLSRQESRDKMLSVWLIAIGSLILYGGGISTGSAESFGRALLFITPALALTSGVAIAKIYEVLSDYAKNITGRYSIFSHMVNGFGVLIIIFLFVGVFDPATPNSLPQKATSLGPIKQFSGGFFEGCNWIDSNTPQDSYLLTIWEARAFYACKRQTSWASLPDLNTILFTRDQRSYDSLQLHGIDYVYIQKFSISNQGTGDTYPPEFIDFMNQNTQWFDNVYENNEVIVYQVI